MRVIRQTATSQTCSIGKERDDLYTMHEQSLYCWLTLKTKLHAPLMTVGCTEVEWVCNDLVNINHIAMLLNITITKHTALVINTTYVMM